MAADSVGCETRFVTDAPNVDIVVSASKPEFDSKARFRVFRGDFQCQDFELEPGRVYSLRINPPEAFAKADPARLREGGFSPDVWRIVADRGGTLFIHAVNTFGHGLRAPFKEELPRLNWLAYGSSITNSSLEGYPHFAARKLKVQVQNKGMSGSCQCEPELIDWLVDGCEWDFVTLELGINMRGGFTPEAFRGRVEYALGRFASKGKPVAVINIFPNCLTPEFASDINGAATVAEREFNLIVRDVAEKAGSGNVHFLDGHGILDDFTGLSGDLLHPTAFGHALMGANLASALEEMIGGLPGRQQTGARRARG